MNQARSVTVMQVQALFSTKMGQFEKTGPNFLQGRHTFFFEF